MNNIPSLRCRNTWLGFCFFVFLWVHFIQGPESHVTQILHRSGADALFPVGDGRMDNVFTLIASVESN